MFILYLPSVICFIVLIFSETLPLRLDGISERRLKKIGCRKWIIRLAIIVVLPVCYYILHEIGAFHF